MIEFKIKELLEKNKISRYKLRIFTGWNYKRVNDFYFGKVKSIKVEELEELCKIFKCNVSDIMNYKK